MLLVDSSHRPLFRAHHGLAPADNGQALGFFAFTLDVLALVELLDDQVRDQGKHVVLVDSLEEVNFP
jgi:hypothetical protein